MTLVKQFLNKFEALSISKRTKGRMTTYLAGIAKRVDAGELVGYVNIRLTPTKLQVVVFKNISFIVDFDAEEVSGDVIAWMPVSVTRKPKVTDYKITPEATIFRNQKFKPISDDSAKALIPVINQSLNPAKAVVAPVAPAPIAVPSVVKSVLKLAPKVPDSELIRICNELTRSIISQNKAQYNHLRYFEPRSEIYNKEAESSIRDWGNWIYPEDVDPEDDEDYDWKELAEPDRKLLEAIIEQFRRKYPTLKISYSLEEKNNIDLFVGRK